jgi:acyl-CoA reductase-like NAD-dependent aldehyde dehydrogenase
VGPGNVPVYVEKSANLSMAVNNIIASKTFDNGTICSSDQSVIFDDKDVAAKALDLFRERGAYICNGKEKAALEAIMFDRERGVPSVAIVGKSPSVIAEMAGFSVPDKIKMLVVPLTTVGPDDYMSHEKLSPVLGYVVVGSKDEAIATACRQLEFGGAGHSADVFTASEEIAREYALRVPANRVVWNQPSVFGTIGGLYNALVPSLTLGCGARGGNITTDNVGYRNLLNIKVVAKRGKPESIDE